jgi:inner membrane protein
MDNLAHSLFGAVIAETGMKRLTPLATATLVVGANLPDVDAFVTLAGDDAALFWRRGVTHGVLALSFWPVVLTLAMLGVDRLRRARRPGSEPASARWIFALSVVGIWSHTSLDWLNSYGVRWWLPFDGRWSYGDALFIIDPWFWLLTGAAVVLARTSRPLGVAGWSVAGLATTGLVVATPLVPLEGRLLWLVGVVCLLVARLSGPRAAAVERLARGCFAALVVYVALMTAGSWRARTLAAAWLDAHALPYEHLVPNPLAANSLAREVIVVRDDRYAFLRVELCGGAVGVSAPDVARGDDATRVIGAALARPEHAGLRNWLRLPAYEVYREGGGWRVIVRDMRYARLGRSGPGDADITVSDAEVAAVPSGAAHVPRP